MDDDVRQSSTDRYALSQAYRWKAERDKAMQELRQLKDRSRDTTVSAYDLLPEEEREALRWVREHGGLDSVKKLLDWVVGHCSTKQQLDFDFWLSGRVMYELGFDEDMTDRDEVERRLLARLMPEGYEWPRYESGEPLRYEDRYVYDGREREVWHVDFDSSGEPTILNKDGTRSHPDKGERVERPAPKVLDADGVEIRVGDTVYYVDGHEQKVNTVARLTDGLVQFGRINEAGYVTYCEGACISPDQLTHQRPVLDADGVEVHKGDEVWSTTGEFDGKRTVSSVHIDPDEPPYATFEERQKPYSCLCCYLIHRAPVLAADGKPLRDGDEVWRVKDGSGPYHVQEVRDGTSVCVEETSCEFMPKELTHERPDSWERIDEDAEKDPCGYFGFDGEETCGKCPASGKNCEQTMALDIVRRARALAERERGE